jgi:hypothetical protein
MVRGLAAYSVQLGAEAPDCHLQQQVQVLLSGAVVHVKCGANITGTAAGGSTKAGVEQLGAEAPDCHLQQQVQVQAHQCSGTCQVWRQHIRNSCRWLYEGWCGAVGGR